MRFSRSSSYLVKHKHIFYVRISVPQDLKSVLGKTEIRHSLRTAYLQDSRPKASRVAGELKQLFNFIRQSKKHMDQQEIQRLVDSLILESLNDIERD
ncbi:DUF6538 domain-containing protein [uncultured Pseudodesulfovibrio sp.]|uniref:DUF6538 domain-containing protein n=1 Tax=uncultured Pseudodesulfovibrio sp. TaxID=2035858 RepID=UPI0029C900D3|nr:DUF6538 domain-containing protein [uncultured Pseudodesulfovibrio sp.]